MRKTIITAEKDSLSVYLKKIWQHKALIVTLAKRDLKVKYAQTVLGLAWTIIQPLTAVVVFTLFFSVILDFNTPYPYALFVLSGILIWGLFNYIFSQGSLSLTSNQDIIRKLYFPKIILPLSKILVALVEFVVTLFFLIVLMIFFKTSISWGVFVSVLAIVPVVLFSIGLALILAALTIKNRDLIHIIPFLVNFGIWFTPVFYPVTLIPEQFSKYLYINPMAACIQLFRWGLFGEPINSMVFVGLFLCLVTFLIGFFVFRNAEDSIVDNI